MTKWSTVGLAIYIVNVLSNSFYAAFIIVLHTSSSIGSFSQFTGYFKC